MYEWTYESLTKDAEMLIREMAMQRDLITDPVEKMKMACAVAGVYNAWQRMVKGKMLGDQGEDDNRLFAHLCRLKQPV